MTYSITYYINGVEYPILDPYNDQLGRFVLSAELTEAINVAGMLTLSVAYNHPNVNQIKISEGEMRVMRSGETILRAMVTSVTTDFYGTRTYKCEGLAAYLLSIPVGKWKVEQLTGTIGYKTVTCTTNNVFDYMVQNLFLSEAVFRSALPGIQLQLVESDIDVPALYGEGSGTLLEAFTQLANDAGLLLVFNYEKDWFTGYQRIKMYVTDQYGEATLQPIELGKNMLNLEREQGMDTFYNAVQIVNDYQSPYSTGQDKPGLWGVTASRAGYAIKSGVLYDEESVAKFGMRCQRVETINYTVEKMEEYGYTLLDVAKEYDNIKVGVYDLSGCPEYPITAISKKQLSMDMSGVLHTATGNQLCFSVVEKGHFYRARSKVQQESAAGHCRIKVSFSNSGPVNGLATDIVKKGVDDGYAKATGAFMYLTANVYNPETGNHETGKDFENLIEVYEVSTEEPFEPGSFVMVISEPHGFPDPGAAFGVTQVQRNLIDPATVSLTLGQREISLTHDMI